MARLLESKRNSGKTRKTHHNATLWCCILLALGGSLYNILGSGFCVPTPVTTFDAPAATVFEGASVGGSSHSNSNGDRDKTDRFSKYFQTYRYILPAKRADMHNVTLPAGECGRGPDFDPWWKLSLWDGRSRFQEDRFIYETFFKNAPSDFRGTYLELGAFDGWGQSNTRFFDDCLGWKGLLIEGSPENYQKTVANRPYAHKMSFAPSCSAEYEAINKTIPFYKFQGPKANVGLVEHARAHKNSPTVDVPCGPLSPILEDVFAENNRTGLPTLDFFSLDVESAEPLVLSTIDFQAIRINILMIEIENKFCRFEQCQVRMDVRAKMDAQGYKRYNKLVPASDIYVHPESPFQVPESIAIPN